MASNDESINENILKAIAEAIKAINEDKADSEDRWILLANYLEVYSSMKTLFKPNKKAKSIGQGLKKALIKGITVTIENLDVSVVTNEGM